MEFNSEDQVKWIAYGEDNLNMATFFSRISYSFGNEDWDTEERALAIEPGDRAVTITASGDRPLHVLLGDPKEVIAVDANPHQNQLLRLKVGAMQALEYHDYIAFLGAAPCNNRGILFDKVLKALEPDAAAYWKGKRSTVLKGIIYQGAVERWLKRVNGMLRLFRGKKIDKLFSFDNIAEQKEFVEKEWNTRVWRGLFYVLLNPFVSRIFLKDPGLYDHVDGTISVGEHLHQRMHSSLCRHLAKENQLISLILRGEISPEGFPPYLTEEGFKTIRSRLNRLTIHTGELVELLQALSPNSMDRFSLSDVASYLSDEKFNEMVRAMIRASKPGARFSLRQFMSRHKMDPELAKKLAQEPDLEKQLERDDRCFVYCFTVGSVLKPVTKPKIPHVVPRKQTATVEA